MLTSHDVFARIDDYFLAPERLTRVELFSRYARNVEGWFNGELLYLFHAMAAEGLIGEWGSEVRVAPGQQRRFDFKLQVQGGPLFLELKTLFHGIQAGQPVDLGVYFPRTDDGVGITGDVIKLMRVTEGVKALLLFVHPRPALEKWPLVLESYARRIAPITVREISTIDRYPPPLYICKLSVEGGF